MKAMQKGVDEYLEPMTAVSRHGKSFAHENLSYHETSAHREGLLAKVSYVAQVRGPCCVHYHLLSDLEDFQVAALHWSTNYASQLYMSARLGLNLMSR